MSNEPCPASGATAPSAALTSSQGPGAGTSVEEARRALESAIIAWASHDSGERLRDGGAFFQPAIDAFAAAVRAEALAPREPSPECGDAERRLRSWATEMHPHMGAQRTAENILSHDVVDLFAELDRLRAALEASREDVRRLLAARGVET